MSEQTNNRRGKAITVIVLLVIIGLAMALGAWGFANAAPFLEFPEDESLRHTYEIALTLIRSGVAL